MEPISKTRAPWLRRALLLFVGLTGSAIALSSCFSSNTVECPQTGLICPEGFVCTADGTGCTNTVCGNEVVDPGEACDDGNLNDNDDCPSALSNATACQVFTCGDGFVDQQGTGPDETEDCDTSGESASCDDDCTPAACGDGNINEASGEVCDNGRGGPEMGASGDSEDCNRDCTPSVCGDGILNMADMEQCDDGNTDPGDDCSPTCRVEMCGNGVTDPGEACDDMDTDNNDECRNDCQSNNDCGNGVLDDHLPRNRTTDPEICLNATTQDTQCAEVCDDGNNVSADGCSANCLSEEICSNAIRDEDGDPTATPPNPPELCDDGNNVDDDLCRNDCQGGAGCGNGLVDPLLGEQCDDGTGGTQADSATCDRNCSAVICGDGYRNAVASEQCDPGAVGVSIATCDANCTTPACGDNFVNPAFGEFCDSGAVNTATCDNDCSAPRCGDSIFNAAAGEACDSGGVNSATCDNNCTTATCGDGFINTAANEVCDDGNAVTTDGCANCVPAECGDGFLYTAGGEQCDDGNDVNTDNCTNACTNPRCGDGFTQSGEFCDAGGTSSATCDSNCTAVLCGDGFVNTAAGEQCDDSNVLSGDGCTGTCVLEPFTLAIAKAGAGAGTVTSAPTGINCGTDCTESYPINATVTLSATPTALSYFVGWSGGGCTGTASCVVTMDAAKTVVATFEPNRLTVTRAGNGGGSVASAPAGITCGSDCTEDFNVGTDVTLTATPDANVTFTGWSGACTGTGPCVVAMTQARAVTATFTLNTHVLTVAKTGNGTGTVTSAPAGINCGSDCTETYNAFTSVTLTATPDANNTFAGWSGGGCSGTGTCTVSLTAATTVTASFTLNQHQLTVAKAGNGAGTVTSAPAGISCGTDCTETYNAFTSVTLTAAASTGSTFTGWSGGGCSGTGTCVVSITAATTVTATFTLDQHTLTVAKAGNGTGTVTSNPAGISCGSDCSETYNFGTSVTLSAVPDGTSVFTGWSGGGCSGTGACVVSVTAATSVTATFTLEQHTLTVAKAGTGSGTVTSNPTGISCGSDCSEVYNETQVVQLTATPTTGSSFAGWSGGGCSGTGTCSVTIGAATTVTATFTLIQHTLTVVKTGTGTGTVTSGPSGIDCGTDCTESYAFGTVVTLFASATAGSTFAGWSGSGCSGTGNCTVTMDAAKSVTASFTRNVYTLTVVKIGDGNGTVTSSPSGINCGGDCLEVYDSGTVVTLTAAPTGGSSTFAGWSGGGCSGTGTCVVTMNESTTVTAAFVKNQQLLTVNKAGTGTGLVQSAPAGISCGTDCTELYAEDTVVVLTATPDTHNTFTGWSGACTGTGVCIVTMSATRTVTATFTANTFTLTASLDGDGDGTITSAPAGINCPGDCAEVYNAPQQVVLTATPTNGSVFTGWSGGGCSGTGTCTVTMTSNQAVTATFELQTFSLSVAFGGNGTGTVTSAPAGISCPGDCSETVEFGTQLVLTAVASANNTFTGWSGGGCSGTGTCTVTVGSNVTVTAGFAIDEHTLDVTVDGDGDGSVTANAGAINCPGTCSDDYLYNTIVTLTATPATGSTFTGWSGACMGTGTCQVTMTQARSVTATFDLQSFQLDAAVTGSGTIMSVAPGINCPGDCSETYDYDTDVMLVAAPATGWTFAGWGGACAVFATNPNCTVDVTAAQSVTALFTIQSFALTVAPTGDGSGTITSGDALINCPGDCTETYDHGTPVVLTATAASGSTFLGWTGGGCSGTGTCNVSVTAMTSVTAEFDAP